MEILSQLLLLRSLQLSGPSITSTLEISFVGNLKLYLLSRCFVLFGLVCVCVGVGVCGCEGVWVRAHEYCPQLSILFSAQKNKKKKEKKRKRKKKKEKLPAIEHLIFYFCAFLSKKGQNNNEFLFYIP